MLLFEYGEWIKVNRAPELRRQLRDLWGERLFVADEQEYSEVTEDRRFQPFLNFDGDLIRANNFVGFIQNEEELIEIFPKVFKGYVAPEHKESMLRHIFYWFRYCRRWRFPFTQATLDSIEFNQFPELIINLIAASFLETISLQPLSLYQPVEETLYSPRGSINFKRYVANGLSHGNPHKIDCDHDPFLFDNRLNRAIKFCSRLLLAQTSLTENARILQEIIFILDEVEDVITTIHDLESVSINPFFSEYSQIVELCRMVLMQQLYSTRLSDLTRWCLLLPMEYVFEDFVAGFLERHFRDRYRVEYQKSNKWLSESPKAFQMQHDILLTSRDQSGRQIVVDTKYKLRASNYTSDVRRGISQSDMYQMVAYALRRGCRELFLIYPNLSEELDEPDTFTVRSELGIESEILITAVDIPFWSLRDFAQLGDRLYQRFSEILIPENGEGTI